MQKGYVDAAASKGSTARGTFTSLRGLAATAVLALCGLGVSANAAVITFDDGAGASGAVLGSQYAAQGVTFAPGGGTISGVVNPASTTQGFATNTSLLITTAASETVTAPLSGLILRSTNGWLAETGDAVFTMTFTSAVTALSIDFGSVGGSVGQPSIYAVNPATGIALAVGAPTLVNGTVTAVGIPTGATTFVVLPGNYNDYVGLDNINFTAVPEPGTLVACGLGMGAIAALRRRRAA